MSLIFITLLGTFFLSLWCNKKILQIPGTINTLFSVMGIVLIGAALILSLIRKKQLLIIVLVGLSLLLWLLFFYFRLRKAQ